MSDSNMPTRSLINWFEIPVRDLDRAQRFYETVLGHAMRRERMAPGHDLALFPYPEEGTGGCLVHGEDVAGPSLSGSLVYLDAGPTLDAAVARVLPAGGRVVQTRIDLPDGMGSYVHIVDTEGNRVGLHALA